jgi:hypothetical protein
MLLEVRVWGSREWYEVALPLIEGKGFKMVPELGWSDPSTDGEFMGFYFRYCGSQPLPFQDFCKLVEQVHLSLETALTPPAQFAIVAEKAG